MHKLSVTLASATLLGFCHANAQTAAPSLAWTRLFQRQSGWTGADGIFSFSEDGWDAPADPRGSSRTMITFADTFIGKVDGAGAREPGVQLVHNTAARLDGTDPTASIHFHWRHASDGAAPIVTPSTPQSLPGDWYWPEDGLVTKGHFYQFNQRVRSDPGGGAFPFQLVGVDLTVFRLSGAPGGPGAPIQVDTPFYLPAQGRRGSEQFGNAVLANTREAGSPLADGFVYVFGVRNDRTTKRLLASRVLVGNVSDFAAYSFWNGSAWVSDIGQAVPIASRISSEFSVTPLPDGRFALVYQLDDLSDEVAISYATAPTGPFSAPHVIYVCPEPGLDPSGNVYTYNAKAHPALSKIGHLLISYNVNSFSLQENLDDAAIYAPRFIDLPLPAR